ncbi:MAG: HD domain-containing protein [Candidatus Heimdallarchaeota archaeon]|nr:HD domain-containing protein [Candidatus Heimdallarchaeota archaeon]MCK4953808.1 HD domain-containing protein [Candidatus Heimdallarchaeota archaeon]
MKINKQNLRFFKNLTDFNHFIIKVHEFVRQQFLQYESKSSHSLEHTIRVANLCLELGVQLDAALDVVLTAALFHDVGRPIEELTGKCHAEISAEIAREFLERELRSELISDVGDAINSHRFSKKTEATTKESRILKDADAIDALGAVGIYRTISYSAEKGLNLEEARKHFDAKLLKLPSLMHFPITKEIAERECEILLKFVEELDIGIYHSKFELFLDKLV